MPPENLLDCLAFLCRADLESYMLSSRAMEVIISRNSKKLSLRHIESVSLLTVSLFAETLSVLFEEFFGSSPHC